MYLVVNECVSQVQQIKIDDKNILALIDRYESYIKSTTVADETEDRYAILLRIDKERLYLSFSYLMSDFINNIPDKFFEYHNRNVFVYDGSVARNNSTNFNNFYNEFRQFLGNDVNADESYNVDYHAYISANVEQWLILDYHLKKRKVLEIPIFPRVNFFDEFLYDDEGYLKYKDGYYHSNAVNEIPRMPENFVLRQYVLENTDVSVQDLKKANVVAIISIDEYGAVQKVEIEGMEDKTLIEQLTSVLLKMPKWQAGKVGNKTVKVRLRQKI
jgi:hypothetical protein